ncbi:baseplate J/gp47 family protein [Chromobacterium violaceum]|uniref:baseplate J/gp47 family protein n=1 Tax=Chromobacterium violaceum TaxID=536 RepID=UPI0009DB48F6|nr:baseplate J/gp47 family protein [Chromobacterium violaceum]QRO32060.1 baseplate J/gp47 family protein [Chromobacterium violaceum]QRQ18139.1 baseplate J/gp47 family protein [Chromobacterium violaceum]
MSLNLPDFPDLPMVDPAAAASAMADAYLKLGGQQQYPKQMAQLLTEMLANRQPGLAAADLPKFIDDDPKTVAAQMAAAYQDMAGKRLYPGQVEQLLIDLFAYRESLARAAFNDAGRQNLVAFARAPMLDYLGELVGVARQPAQAATAQVELTFPAYAEGGVKQVVLPAGARIGGSAAAQFQTVAPLAVTLADKPQAMVCEVAAIEPGEAGNLPQAGDLNLLLDDPGVPVAVAGLTKPWGGAEAEDDERLRQRIRLAPEAYSWGSANRYRLAAMTAAADAADVRVISPRPDGTVRVVVLGKNGAPSAETLRRVQAALADSKARMINDRIEVVPAEVVDYAIRLEVDVLTTRIPDLVCRMAKERCQGYAANLARRLGGDIVPSQIKTALHDIDGLYDVRVLEPADKRVLSSSQWPRCAAVEVTLGRMVSDG